MASRLFRGISKLNLVIARQGVTKNGTPFNQLRPKTPDDEYRDMFQKVMGPDYYEHTKKQMDKLNKRTSKWKVSAGNCGEQRGKCGVKGIVKTEKCGEEKVSKCGDKGDVKICEEDVHVPKFEEGIKCGEVKASPDDGKGGDTEARMKDSKCGDQGVSKCGDSVMAPSKEDECGSQPKTMRALVLDVCNRKVELQDAIIPTTLKKGEVSIQVKYAAANFTDFYVLDGKIPSNQKTLIPGRELSGIVLGTGDEVERVRVGDHVVVAPCQPNTLCPYCLHKDRETCIKESSENTFGINRNGGWAQFTTVPASLVYKICGVPLEKAALLPILAQVMCAMDTMKIEPDSHILILGCGLAGMIITQLLKDKGHGNVFILEDNSKRVDVIKSLGYEHLTLDKLCCHEFDIIFVNGTGAHAMQLAVDSLRSHGRFYIFGLPAQNGDNSALKIEANLISQRLLTVQGLSGTPVNPSKVPVDLAEKILDCGKLGIPVVNLEDFNDTLTQLMLGDISAAVFKFDK